MPSSSVLILAAAALGTPLDHLALVATRAYTQGSHRTITNGERLLKWLPPPGHNPRQQSKEVYERELLAYLHKLHPERQASNETHI